MWKAKAFRYILANFPGKVGFINPYEICVYDGGVGQKLYKSCTLFNFFQLSKSRKQIAVSIEQLVGGVSFFTFPLLISS